MSKFNDFTQKFDNAVSAQDVDGAAKVITDYVRAHSEHTGKLPAESFKLTHTWMGIDHGENRAAFTRDTPAGRRAIETAMADLGLLMNDAPS